MPKLLDDTKYTKDANEERIILIQGRKVNLNRLEQTNVVRIFVSSTFSDMRVERNTLLEKAYPDLRSFCQKLGLDFQAMDMRWGIQDSAMIDHSICELCLDEIKTCKRLSIGPFFVAFLGNRYGYRPVPSTISVQNFDKFEVIANEKGYTSSNLLTKWYQKDANAVPVHYVLQPITSEYPHFNDDDVKYEKERNIQRQKWSDTSQQLADVIRKCASEAR
uniref:DUF4062 domain-containing protein n=2 Tax=Ciona intestinalis TaxID=7719 RepID=H2XQA3_CIOIN